ncbi:MAG: bifunctional folylpolyglutamate synthase/dihydrofolate synthase [Acidobacteria bacterium]|nr:bifunctional folylpolyglutamate synthase/dihydrofolate synthase [Acidobacteriota bacterium]
MTYAESVEYLLSLIGSIERSNFGLHRMERLMEQLGRPDRSFRPIHIAGTNGKGSTAAMIAAALESAGRRTGLSSSPHLIRFNERVRLDGKEIEDADFATDVSEVRAAAEAVVASDGRSMRPTLFEMMTAAAFCGFRRATMEWGVVEVGLGGRLDATNVVSPELTVITPIGRDHERFLGVGERSIAREKAGILKAGCPVVVSEQSAEALEEIRARAAELEIQVIQIPSAWRADETAHTTGHYRFLAVRVDGAAGSRDGFPVTLGLAGRHQVGNALTAIAALDRLGVETRAIQEGLAGVNWPGRLERVAGPPEFLLDAAHNPAGARVLAQFLSEHCADRTIHLIYGSSSDKPVEEIAGILFPCVRRVTVTASRVTRSIGPEELLRRVGHLHPDVATASSTEAAMERVGREAKPRDLTPQDLPPQDLTVVAGSIFLVGEAKAVLSQLTAISVGQ